MAVKCLAHLLHAVASLMFNTGGVCSCCMQAYIREDLVAIRPTMTTDSAAKSSPANMGTNLEKVLTDRRQDELHGV